VRPVSIPVRKLEIPEMYDTGNLENFLASNIQHFGKLYVTKAGFAIDVGMLGVILSFHSYLP
jgi:hypothetical protein